MFTFAKYGRRNHILVLNRSKLFNKYQYYTYNIDATHKYTLNTPIKRHFSSVKDDRPRYMLRITIFFGLIGVGAAAYFGVPESFNDVISFIGNTGNNSNTLPKINAAKTVDIKKPDVGKIVKSEEIKPPKPKSIPKPNPSPTATKPIPPKPKPKATPKPKPTETPKPKPKPKPIPKKVDPKPLIMENEDNVTDASVALYRQLRQEFKALKESESLAKPDDLIEEPIETKPTTISMEDHETQMKQLEDAKELRIRQLISELTEKTKFLKENLQKLEDGQIALDESKKMYEEMVDEYKEMMINNINYNENERKKRIQKLKELTVDVRLFDGLLKFYDTNAGFLVSLSELNNIIIKFEHKLNNGISYENEMNYLINFIPKKFISHQLLSKLNALGDTMTNTNDELLSRFKILEQSLRETSMTPKSSNNLFGNILAKMFSSLLFSELISRTGTSINSRISRAGFALKNNDLQSALTELDHLDEDILYPAQDWIKAARQRLLVDYALKMLKSELLSRSIKLNMDAL